MNAEKTKQIKSYIYSDIYDVLKETDEFKQHGLTYAVNVILANSLKLSPPPTPTERMGMGGSKPGRKAAQNAFTLPENWFELLETLIKGGTWYRRDYPLFSKLSVKMGLIELVPRFGAKATEKLRAAWRESRKKQNLLKLYKETAESEGYRFEESTVGGGVENEEKK